ncbi:hypothetical protein V6N12_069438 [Hibiscus sabdariffa]|uniref:GBF-interacting protein 1 N-terminal domain-containing protein n=1 Tax=Hibiscus sabdariffa TaxID=183260 RepID=A0ABR2FE04_9ROSI
MSSQGGGGGRGGGSRVSIPENAKKTIKSIREITGKQHSDEEVYAVLKECFMDPNETAQKLLYLDTFHEVKRKHDKKTEASDSFCTRTRGLGQLMKLLYIRSARNAFARRENRKVENNAASHVKKTTTAIPNGRSSCGSQLSVKDGNGETKDGLPANKPITISVQSYVDELPVTIPAPSFVSLIRGQEKSASNSNASSSSSTSTTVSSVYSSASNPVVVPTMSHHAGTVGTIKNEIGGQQEAAEINIIQGNKHVPDDDVSKTEKIASEVPISIHGNKLHNKSKAAEQLLHLRLQLSLLKPILNSLLIHMLRWSTCYFSIPLRSSDEPSGEPSSRSQGMLSTLEGDNASQLQSPPELEKVPEPEGNISSDAELKVDQSKQEVHLHPEGWEFSSSIKYFNTASSELCCCSPPSSSPFPQPFPPNYFHYPHYLTPFYMHAMHQYVNLTGLPQQPPAGNLYMPPGAAAPGVKFPLPEFKPGTNAGNPAHFTIPSGYGPFTPPPVGYNLSVPSVTSGSSSGKRILRHQN